MPIDPYRQNLKCEISELYDADESITRDIMLRLLWSFEFSITPFDEPSQFDQDWMELEEWWTECFQMARPEWLDVLHNILENPPAYSSSFERGNFEASFGVLLEIVAEKFPQQARAIFGPEVKGFVSDI